MRFPPAVSGSKTKEVTTIMPQVGNRSEPAGAQAAFRVSRPRTLAIATAGVILSGLCAMIVFGWGLDVATAHFVWLVALLGLLLFAPATFLSIRQLFWNDVVVEISRKGVRDVRISRQPIPWSAIKGYDLVEVRGQKFVMLDIDPELVVGLEPSRVARIGAALNRAFGYTGYHIGTQGLAGSFADLHDAIAAGWAAHHALYERSEASEV